MGTDEIGFVFSYDDENTLQWVLSGLTDAGVTDDYNFDVAFPGEAREQPVELARTEYTPRQVAVIRSGLDEGLVQSIVQVLTALEIRMAVRKLNVNLAEKGEIFRVGVGINTGMALAGAVGPMERQEYTIVGNTVNLAARIDGLNKQFPEHDILISPWTFDALGEHRAKFNLVSLGSVQIRGRNDPVEIWAVQGKV